METPPLSPVNAAPAPFPETVAAAVPDPAEQAASMNPSLRVASNLGRVARTAYEKTVMTLGFMQSGVGMPEAAPAAPPPDAAPAAAADTTPTAVEGGSRWGNLLSRTGNIVRASAVAYIVGGTALRYLAVRHGIETGGGGGTGATTQHAQTFAEALPSHSGGGASHSGGTEYVLTSDTLAEEIGRASCRERV